MNHHCVILAYKIIIACKTCFKLSRHAEYPYICKYITVFHLRFELQSMNNCEFQHCHQLSVDMMASRKNPPGKKPFVNSSPTGNKFSRSETKFNGDKNPALTLILTIFRRAFSIPQEQVIVIKKSKGVETELVVAN